MRARIVVAYVAAALAGMPAVGESQETEVLRRDLEQMRQRLETITREYQEAINTLSERLQQLEAAPPQRTAPPPVVQRPPGPGPAPPSAMDLVRPREPFSLYERRGADLVIEVPVTYAEAALGATVDVPTPDGTISLKVPSGSQDGKLLRVRGKGAPKLKGSGRGDLLARVRVTVPKKLTKAEREALENLKKVSRENPREDVFARS